MFLFLSLLIKYLHIRNNGVTFAQVPIILPAWSPPPPPSSPNSDLLLREREAVTRLLPVMWLRWRLMPHPGKALLRENPTSGSVKQNPADKGGGWSVICQVRGFQVGGLNETANVSSEPQRRTTSGIPFTRVNRFSLLYIKQNKTELKSWLNAFIHTLI